MLARVFDAEAVRIAPLLLIALQELDERQSTPTQTATAILRYAFRLLAGVAIADMRIALSTIGTLIYDVVEAANESDAAPNLNPAVLRELILEALTTGTDQPASTKNG